MRWSVMVLPLLAGLAGCAAAGLSRTAVPATEIPRLERLVADEPAAGAPLVRLGVAYGNAGRHGEARAALDRAVALPDAPASAWVHLGAAAEREGDPAAAEAAYRRYMEVGGRRAARQVAGRLVELRRAALVAEARRALALESELSLQPPRPASIAVLPLVVDGPPEYAALGRGLSEMLATDLSRTGRLEVLERARIQALMEEAQLGLAGFTEPATAARTGRLLRTERVVQGQLVIPAEDEIELHSVLVSSTQPDDLRQARESGALASLLEVQLQLALSIYRELGIELTPTELALLLERPTANLQAFLAYSRGLEAMDRNQTTAALAEYRLAAQLDPGFALAVEAVAEMEQSLDAGTATLDAVESAAEEETAEATIDIVDGLLERPIMEARGALDRLLGAGGAETFLSLRERTTATTDQQAQFGETAPGGTTGSASITVRRPQLNRTGGSP